jgi:hypothetical protein
MEKYFIDIPFKLKDEAKALGAKYDVDNKKWYVEKESQQQKFEKVYLQVPYDDKDVVKDLGCIWSKDYKKWWTCKFNNKLINQYTVIEIK